MKSRHFLLFAAFLLMAGYGFGQAQPGATNASAAAATIKPAAAPFDIKAATDAYLASVPADKRARSDAYFEGGYWLKLWDFLYMTALMAMFLYLGSSARMRDLAERLVHFRPLQTMLYWVQFIVLVTVLSFPLTVYEGYIREHKYGLATQTFRPWLWDQFKALLVGMVAGAILLSLLFGVLRRLQRTWWIWGAVVVVLFSAFSALIIPIYVAPLFNRYTRLEDPKVVQPILSMARANGIPAHEVYQVDASRQTTRISAFVFGFMGTERIVLNDNLLKRCSLPEIESVMGHEMGHYVLHHIYKALVYSLIATVLAFAFLRYATEWSLRRWGARWHVLGIGDVAVLPLLVLLLGTFFFVLTPIDNTITRTQEYEADIFGLNAARQPDAEAEVALKLGEYRKLDPGPVEEWIFYDHPSGRARITAAMRWKGEHLSELNTPAPVAIPARTGD